MSTKGARPAKPTMTSSTTNIPTEILVKTNQRPIPKLAPRITNDKSTPNLPTPYLAESALAK